METLFFSNDNNLSQGSFAKQQQWGDNSAERQSKWRKFKWRVNENMQGKDVKAASETTFFSGTCLSLLWIPFSADRSMDIKKNTFWGARALVSPNLYNSQNSTSKMAKPCKGVSLIWDGPIAYLVFSTISINFHKTMSVPYMFSIARVFAEAHIYIYIYIRMYCNFIHVWYHTSNH